MKTLKVKYTRYSDYEKERMVLYWSLKLIGSQPSYRTVRKRMDASVMHCKYRDKEGMQRNETVKTGSSDHRVPKKMPTLYIVNDIYR